MAADGTIVIDARIDTNNLNAGVGKIGAACKRAASNVNALGKNMKNSFAKAPLSANTAASSVQSMGSRIKTAFVSLPSVAKSVVGRVKQIATTANSAKISISKMGNVAKKAAKFLKGMGKSAKQASGSTKGLGGGLKALLRYGLGISTLYTLARKLREALTEGLSNLSAYSSQTNASIANLKASLSTLKNSLATAFAPVLNVVAPILTKLIDLLATAASYISMFFAVLSGKSTYTKAIAVQADYSAALEDTAAGASDAAKSTEEAAEAAQDYLSPLDEINRYTTDKAADSGSSGGGGGGAGGGGTTGPLFEEAQIAPGMTEFVDRLKGILEKLFTPFKQAWEAEGAGTIEAAKYALSSLQALAAAVGRSLMEVWTNGTGTQTLTLILQIIQNILNLVGNLATRFTEAWTANDIGTQIIQNIWNLLNIVLGTIERITGATAEWALTLDFTPLLESINGLLLALQPLATTVFDTLAWAYETVLLPLERWRINEAAPAVVDLLASAFTALNNILSPVAEGLKAVYDRIEPIVLWVESTAISVIGKLQEAIETIGDVFAENGDKIENIMRGIGDIVSWVWVHILQPTLDGLVDEFVVAFDIVVGVVGFAIDAVIGILDAVIEPVKKIISNLAMAFEGFTEFLGGVFIGNFQNVLNGAKKFLKGIVNSIIGFLNGLSGAAAAAVNAVVRALNKLKIKIPDWVPGFGGKSFGFNLKMVTVPQIPYLASGAVIPPRSEFLAVLGDQKSGTNIETPEKLLRDLFRQEFAAAMAGGGKGGGYRFTAQINRRTIFDEIIDEAKLRQMATGRNPFELA